MEYFKKVLLTIMGFLRCWLSLVLTVFFMVLIQLIIHFGSKFALFPYYVSHFFENGYDNEFQTGNNIFWIIPLPGSIAVYLGLYLFFFFLISRAFKIRASLLHDISLYKFFHLFIFGFFFVFTFVVIADSGFARSLFFTKFTEIRREDYVIDCSNKTIKFKSHITKQTSPLCNYCYQQKIEDSRYGCKYYGLDSFEPLRYMP